MKSIFTMINYLFLLFILSTLTGCTNDTQTAETVPTEISSQETETDSLLVYGEVKVAEVKEMQLDFPAKIDHVLVKEGAIVNKGEPLITLNFDDYKLQIEILEKQLEGYEIEISGLQGSSNATAANLDAISKELALKKSYASSGQDPDILPLKSNLATLNEDLKEAQSTYETSLALLEAGAISQTEVDQNKLACTKLEEQITNTNTSISKTEDARQLEISALQSKLNATTLEVGNIDTTKASQIHQLQNKIETTTLTLQNMNAKLAAPYLKGNDLISENSDLLIYDITATSGSSISGLGQPLFKIMDLNTLYVTVDIPEESLSSVTIGAPVTLKIADKNIATPITGTISRISDYAKEKDDDTIVEAYITVNTGKENLKPGLSIDAYIN